MGGSYCQKSCAECGKCSGCRAGVYAAECEIAKCCKKMGHASCETCTRGVSCPTRWSRDGMPERLHEKQRREAEVRESYRARAGILAQWVPLIFWSNVVRIAVGMVHGAVDAVKPVGIPVELMVGSVCLLVMAFAYWHLTGADDRFRFVSIYYMLAVVSNAADSLLPEDSVLMMIFGLVIGAIGIAASYQTCMGFRDVMSGIDRQMAQKWENQWKLYRYALIALAAAILFEWIPVLAACILIAAVIVVLFVSIRELVYLNQTMNLCQSKIWD